MTKKHNIKSTKFQFGTPFEVSRPGGIQARVSVDFKKVLSSWFNLSDLLPSRTGIDRERLKNIIPTIFQGHQSESSTKTLKTPSQTSKQTAKRLYIDMSKLEDIKTLDSKEKENLKLILNELKCENEMGNKQTKQNKQAKKQKNKILIEKKSKNSFPKEKIKNTKCSNTKRKKPSIKVGKLRKSISKLSQCRECKHCSEVFDKTFKNKKRKQKQPPTTIVSSTEQLLQTLMVDPRAYGDIKQPINNTEKNSGSSINTIYRKNQNICIKNIELKYLKPTYVVQYNTNDTSVNDDSTDFVYPRGRLYSTAALDAHLGQTSAPDYHEGRQHAAKTPMHYQESNLRIIGMGHGTEEMLRERGNSSAQSSLKREESSEYVPNIKLPVPQGERVTKWPRDPIPSHLLPTEQPATSSIILQTNRVKHKKEAKSRKCMDFVKKCLCLPTKKKDDQKKLHKVQSGMTRIHKDDFIKIGKKSPTNYNNDVIVNRITQDDFFHEDVKTKTKQKLHKKGKSKKVSFR